VVLDRTLEALPVFRLSDSTDDTSIAFAPDTGGRWRVLPAPGERLPGTFDQDVYIELFHRFAEAGFPDDGVITFTLHQFLRSMGRTVDGRTYQKLRSALSRLERTTLESVGIYRGPGGAVIDATFTILTAVVIDRRRAGDRDQLTLFSSLASAEPGDARITLSPFIRTSIASGHTATISAARYAALGSPVARRLYRLLSVARAQGVLTWRVALDRIAEQLPLAQRFPSHLQRVLQPAHEMLLTAGLVRDAAIRQYHRDWYVDYILASRVS
jgi:plasmid replication initiation protein